jgi:Peptidase family M28
MTKFTRAAAAVLACALMVPLYSSATSAAGRSRYVDLDRFPRPRVTGKQIIAGLEDFVSRFPMRQAGTPNNVAAAEFLAREAKRNGFRSRILELQAGTPERTVRVVEAVKRGTVHPDEWIAFIAHYDIVPQTVQGAYDDGSGTNILRYFGKAFSRIKTKRSIALLWFDAEEEGLVASEAYTKRLKKRHQKVFAGLGFDMVGIGFPARYCICVYHGPNPADARRAVPLINHVNFDYLDFPKGDGGAAATEKWPMGTKGHVCNCGPNIRNSDESNFAEAGYFTLRWTGMRTALDYPGYHQPWDTVPFMELVAGSRKKLERGTQNTFRSAYYTALVLDNL